MDPNMKDIFDVVFKMVASVGGVTAAIVGLYQMHLNWRQRKEEFRWKQAELAKEIIDKLLWDEEAFQALAMMDEELDTVEGPGNTEFAILDGDVAQALAVDNPPEDDKSVALRTVFYTLFFYLSRLQHFIDTGLEDVSNPMNYYSRVLAREKETLSARMCAVGHENAKRFLENFDYWKKA